MACTLNKGRGEPCKDTVGGIQAVYFIDFGDLGTPTYASATSYEITDFSEASITAYKYDVKGNSSLEQTITSSRENGTTFYDQILNLTLHKLSVQSHDELTLIAVARPHVIVEDYNGNLMVVGLEHGADVNGGTVVTGGAMGDLSGYTLTLQANELRPANFISGTLADVGITVSTTNIDDI